LTCSNIEVFISCTLSDSGDALESLLADDI
jgi:hypothetical protein